MSFVVNASEGVILSILAYHNSRIDIELSDISAAEVDAATVLIRWGTELDRIKIAGLDDPYEFIQKIGAVARLCRAVNESCPLATLHLDLGIVPIVKIIESKNLHSKSGRESSPSR